MHLRHIKQPCHTPIWEEMTRWYFQNDTNPIKGHLQKAASSSMNIFRCTYARLFFLYFSRLLKKWIHGALRLSWFEPESTEPCSWSFDISGNAGNPSKPPSSSHGRMLPCSLEQTSSTLTYNSRLAAIYLLLIWLLKTKGTVKAGWRISDLGFEHRNAQG